MAGIFEQMGYDAMKAAPHYEPRRRTITEGGSKRPDYIIPTFNPMNYFSKSGSDKYQGDDLYQSMTESSVVKLNYLNKTVDKKEYQTETHYH